VECSFATIGEPVGWGLRTACFDGEMRVGQDFVSLAASISGPLKVESL